MEDRFGTYGLVGVVLFSEGSNALEVDTLLLSCRVLGRGVQHRMEAHLGAIASQRELEKVNIPYIPTKKNVPALEFLDSIGQAHRHENEASTVFSIPSDEAQSIVFEPDENQPSLEQQSDVDSAALTRSDSDLIASIPTQLGDVGSILRQIDARSSQERPALDNQFVAPTNNLEQSIAAVWQQVLGINTIGLDDNFREIGGNSLKAVQLVARLKSELDIDMSVVSLFEYPTIRGVAKSLSGDQAESRLADRAQAARERGEKRRQRRAARQLGKRRN